MPQLSAPTDDFLTELETFGVPLAVCVSGYYLSTPSQAWERVFNGPHDEANRPTRRGGVTPAITSELKKRRFSQQPNDALRRMPDASEAAPRRMTFHSKPVLTFSAERSPLAGAGARADNLGASITTPTEGTSC